MTRKQPGWWMRRRDSYSGGSRRGEWMPISCSAATVALLQRGKATSIFIAGRKKFMQNRKLAVQPTQAPAKKSGEFRIGGELRVTRLGFGAMRITGNGVWADPPDRPGAIRLLRLA